MDGLIVRILTETQWLYDFGSTELPKGIVKELMLASVFS